MFITGIEVFPGNPEVGSNPGSLVGVVPPGNLELTYGDTLRITTSFDYRGPVVDITLYGAIGTRGWAGFDEIIKNEVTYKLPNSPTAFVPVTAAVDIPITADISPGANYDIYCKIKEYPQAGSPQVDDVITITGIPPSFELLEETIYPYAYIYDGPCDVSTFTFTTDPFTPASWIAGLLASHLEDEVRKAGGRVMEMRVYVDKSPLLWTDWRIEVVGTPAPATAGLGMSLGIAWWAVAILAALAIILIIVITWAITTIMAQFKRYPALKDVKPGWKKETLILTIQDSEEFWERPPTPIETLNEMSEEELRGYLDKIAEEEVPTGVNWLPWVIGGVAVLAVGGIAIAAMKKRK